MHSWITFRNQKIIKAPLLFVPTRIGIVLSILLWENHSVHTNLWHGLNMESCLDIGQLGLYFSPLSLLWKCITEDQLQKILIAVTDQGQGNSFHAAKIQSTTQIFLLIRFLFWIISRKILIRIIVNSAIVSSIKFDCITPVSQQLPSLAMYFCVSGVHLIRPFVHSGISLWNRSAQLSA